MAECFILKGGGGGGRIGSDELSATKDYVLSGKTYVGADTNDEIGAGLMADKSGSTTDYSSLDDATGNMGNISALTDLSTGGDIALRIECLIPKGYHDGKSKASIRLWGVNPANVRAGRPIGYTNNSLKGTFTSDANATAPQLLNGYTAYVNGNKITGTLSVNSILSFNAAAYSTTQILLQWQNPYAASGRPFSGVFINYSTSGYPGSYGGTRIYTGYGNNATPGGWSQAIVTMPVMGTTYYFSATAYASGSPSDMWGNTLNAAAATTSSGQQSITSSGTFTVPAGVRNIDIFVVGGGGGGCGGASGIGVNAGPGGGSGYTATVKNYPVSPGQQLAVIVGAGGSPTTNVGGSGGATLVQLNSQTIIQANGGISGRRTNSTVTWPGNGGSYAGDGAYVDRNYGTNAQNGNSDGGGAGGQGVTTRAFGESWNTLFAGAGAGGGSGQYANTSRGYGGPGGGGNGADAMGNVGSSGTPNTGGGGGGGYAFGSSAGSGYAGGSGICIIRWGY